VSLTEADLDRIQDRTELAVLKAFDRHRREDHATCEAACVERNAATHKLAKDTARRVDRWSWGAAGALGLLALPWKKLAALLGLAVAKGGGL